MTTVAELKAELKKRNLSTSGNKAELLSRLEEAQMNDDTRNSPKQTDNNKTSKRSLSPTKESSKRSTVNGTSTSLEASPKKVKSPEQKEKLNDETQTRSPGKSPEVDRMAIDSSPEQIVKKSSKRTDSKSPERADSRNSKSPERVGKNSPKRTDNKSPERVNQNSKSPERGNQNSKSPERMNDTNNLKSKKKKKKKGSAIKRAIEQNKLTKKTQNVPQDDDEELEVEYISAQPEQVLDSNLASFDEFARILNHFALPDGTEEEVVEPEIEPDIDEVIDHMEEDEEEEVKPLTRKSKKAMRMTVAQLKQKVKKPELVEWVDVTAADPLLLLTLKSTKNTIPVPQHWSHKKRYLGGKRVGEKPAYELPEYIKNTGISKMRSATSYNPKAQLRERMMPKLGRITLDYQKLHDAFFRFQTKPPMTQFGDLYYEGKEFQNLLRDRKPGVISDELKEALGMAGSTTIPPPWLLGMQRYGPPPSYPSLRIPGLNAPIPEGASWGYHPGGWGKPPVDEMNRPLYGDVFGLLNADQKSLQQSIEQALLADTTVIRTLWGELDPVEYVSEEEEEEEEIPEEEEEPVEETPAESKPIHEVSTGMVTPLTTSNGTATPDIQLRKERVTEQIIQEPIVEFGQAEEEEPEKGDGEEKPLYTVLSTKENRVGSSTLMGSEFTYNVPTADGSSRKRRFGDTALESVSQSVEVSILPEELIAKDTGGVSDSTFLQQKFTEAQKPQGSSNRPLVPGRQEDLSDMVKDHITTKNALAKKRKTDEAKNSSSSTATKKKKDFKF